VDTATISEAHEDLNARDTIAGLRAELATLKARLEVLETTDVAKAFARVDQLEDEREARLHELRLLVQDHREHIESAQKAIESVKQSSTWKVGNAVISPISKITKRLPR
jgi:chromosome segregation ATPase